MKKRKHRFYIDVTYSSPIEYRKAGKGLALTLHDQLDFNKSSVWLNNDSLYIDKLVVLEKRT